MKKFLLFFLSMMMILGFAINASSGEYYMYANFDRNDGFLGGYDVDSYGDYLYVNRTGSGIDRYTVTTAPETATTDVNTHPNNVGSDGILGTADDNIGPMLTRTLTFDFTYDVSEIGAISISEIYATENGLYFLDEQDAVSYYQFSDGATSKITNSLGSAYDQWGKGSMLARAADGTWWVAGEDNDIYSYDGSVWNKIIDHVLTPGGGHLDGLAIAALDLTNDGIDNAVEYLFAADMTSDYMKRYALDGTMEEVYSYNDTAGMAVEGMGFGANNHFWATSGANLYEIGGGAFEYIEDGDDDDDNDNPVPEPATMLLLGIGLAGFAISRKKKRI